MGKHRAGPGGQELPDCPQPAALSWHWAGGTVGPLVWLASRTPEGLAESGDPGRPAHQALPRALRMEEFFPETYRLDMREEREAFSTLFHGEEPLGSWDQWRLGPGRWGRDRARGQDAGAETGTGQDAGPLQWW